MRIRYDFLPNLCKPRIIKNGPWAFSLTLLPLGLGKFGAKSDMAQETHQLPPQHSRQKSLITDTHKIAVHFAIVVIAHPWSLVNLLFHPRNHPSLPRKNLTRMPPGLHFRIHGEPRPPRSPSIILAGLGTAMPPSP